MKRKFAIAALFALTASTALAQSSSTTVIEERPNSPTVGRAVGGTIDNAMAVPGAVLTWVTGQRGRSVRVEREVVVGEPLSSEVELTVVPDNRDYGYAVVNERRVIVEQRSRRVVKIID